MNKKIVKAALDSDKAVIVNGLWYYKYKIHNKATIYSSGFFTLDEAVDAILEALKDKECVIEIK